MTHPVYARVLGRYAFTRPLLCTLLQDRANTSCFGGGYPLGDNGGIEKKLAGRRSLGDAPKESSSRLADLRGKLETAEPSPDISVLNIGGP